VVGHGGSILRLGGALCKNTDNHNRDIQMQAQMNVFFALIAVIAAGLYALYFMQMRGGGASWREYFTGVGPDVDVAEFNVALPLQDMLHAQPGLSGMGAADCAAADKARQLELGGQYVQRTNNYKRDYPDTCSAPLTELVGAVYRPMELGHVVPCDGQC
jgi:hypothetical protein